MEKIILNFNVVKYKLIFDVTSVVLEREKRQGKGI